jgi:hypothetical protein
MSSNYFPEGLPVNRLMNVPCDQSIVIPNFPDSAGSIDGCPKEPLNFGISFFTPVSSVPGSASFFYLQPLLTGKVFASMALLSISQLFLFLINRIFGLESTPIKIGSSMPPEQTVRMSMSDLQEFLTSVSSNYVQPSGGSTDPTTGTIETPEAPIVVALSIWGEFTDNPYGPTVFLLLPVFTFPGLRGAMPMLIMELLTTIFVRAVVPPQSTGAKPLRDLISGKPNILQFTPENLLNLLNRFSKHF